MNLRLATDKQISSLHEHPDTLDAFLYGADDEPTVAHDPSHELQLVDQTFDLDGGRPLGEAHSFTSKQVAELAARLRAEAENDELTNFLSAGAVKKLGLIVYFST